MIASTNCCFISFIFIGLTLGKSFYSYIENDKSIPNKVKESNSFKIRLNIFAGGMMHMYERWFKDELNCDLNDLSIKMSKIIKEAAKNFM